MRIDMGVAGSATTRVRSVGRQIIAGEALAQYDVVYQSSSDGKFYKADRTDQLKYGVDGRYLVTESGGIGEDATGTAIARGRVQNESWSFSPGQSIILGSTPGTIESSLPVIDEAHWFVPVGQALDSDTIYFDGNIFGLLQGIFNALLNTTGAPGATNPFVLNDDPRLT